jgi:pyruvate/2-oxoglutarate dehydrogenase complex dihydrolipoamide dehydrogenase (E3) component
MTDEFGRPSPRTGAVTGDQEADVIILGLGTGGEDLSLRLLAEGLDVVGIEPSLVGGECAYWACIPSKMMIRAADLLQEARRVDAMAGQAHVTADWSKVATRIRTEATGGWDDSVAVARFESAGGHFVRGRGRLTGPKTVEAGGNTYTARIGIVIATGSRPFIPPVAGLTDVDYWTTHEAIAVETLPESLIILGGGAVGCELGQVFSRFGVAVTIIEGQQRLLAAEEPEASEVVLSVLEREGITVHFGSHAEAVASTDAGVEVNLGDGAVLSAERLLVATGRAVDTAELGLENANVSTSGRFVQVDERMSAGDGVWAIGDVTGTAMLTHVAIYQGSIVGDDILGRDSSGAEYSALPHVTFTDPEVGSVGLTEAQAREAGLDVIVSTKDVGLTFRGWLHGSGNDGLLKLVADRSTGVLVGATSVGPRGGDVLGMLELAIHAKIPVATMQEMIYPYPTFIGGIGEMIGAYGRGAGKVIDPDADPSIFDGI